MKIFFWLEVFIRNIRFEKNNFVEGETSKYPIHEIGIIKKIKKHSLSIKGFTGATNWTEGKTIMFYEEISAQQIGSNYLKNYERYFQRNSRQAD